MSAVKPPRGGFIYEPPMVFPADVVEHEHYKQAWEDLIDRDFLKSAKYQEQQWRAIRIGVHHDVLRFGNIFVARMASLGVPFFPAEYMRSNARQQQLYEDGFSKAKAGKGPHPYGLAVDLVHGTKGWSLTQKQWEFVGHIGKQLVIDYALGIDWGGDWPPLKDNVGWDPAHWQKRQWKQHMAEYPWPPFNKHGYGRANKGK